MSKVLGFIDLTKQRHMAYRDMSQKKFELSGFSDADKKFCVNLSAFFAYGTSNDSVEIMQTECAHFSGDALCTNSDCPNFQKYQEYIDALNKYQEIRHVQKAAWKNLFIRRK